MAQIDAAHTFSLGRAQLGPVLAPGAPLHVWRVALIALAILAVLAWLSPRLFRGYYRISTRAGFWLSQIIAQVVLALIFVFFLTPLGLILRALGKDPLRLKRPQNVSTYWSPAKKSSPLDQMF